MLLKLYEMNHNETNPNIDRHYESAKRKFRVKFWILDVVTIILSYVLAFWIRHNVGGLTYSNNYLYLLLLMIPTFFILIRKSHFTHIYKKVGLRFFIYNFVQLCSLGLLIMISFIFIFKMDDISRVFIFVFFIIYIINLSILQIYRSQSFRNLKKK
jgi:hypothetical protein